MHPARPSTSARFLESYSGSAAGAPGIEVRRHERVLMATWNVLLLVDRPDNPLRGEALDRAAAAAFLLMEDLERRFSRFQPESELNLVNALAASRPVAVSPELFEVLAAAERCFQLSGGAFDPTVGPLMRAWGFDAGRGREPSADEIRRLLDLGGMRRVHLDRERQTVSFDGPGVQLDLGGIGKGAIVDRAAASLRELGASDGAILSGRSTIVVWGRPPHGERWRVGVANPEDPEDVFLELAVRPGTVSSSAAYERAVAVGDRRYGHVLDPRSGRPVESCLGVTAWTPEAMAGDAATTALFVLGRESAAPVLSALGPISALFLDRDPSVWGGVGWSVAHEGPPGFEPGFEVMRS
jgi:thiamine biosynthesis lipoprotein